MRLLFLIFSILILHSCATPIKRPQNRPRAISAKEKLLEYYRNLRAKEWKNRTQKQKRIKRSARAYKRPKPAAKRRQIKQVHKIKWVDKDSQKVEIEQNLAYYCMKNRKSSKFSNEAECYAFTEDIRMNCLEKYEKGDARLTSCVKTRIKN